jgi:receptor protein-tyrosine kinase
MSKIFEALHNSRNRAGQLIPPLDVGAAPGQETTPASVAPTEAPDPACPSQCGQDTHNFETLRLRAPSDEPILPFEQANPGSEQYRTLRTKIVQHPKRPQVILISSAGPGDGKTITAVNLAGVLSLKNDGAVLLVDGDLRRPSVARQFSLPEGPGLAGVLAGATTLEESTIRAAEYPNLYVLQAGKAGRNPAELLDTPLWRATVVRMKSMFKYVVLDSPPIASVADYDLLLAVADGVVMVVRPDHTRRQSCMKALNAIPEPKRLGVVMNCVPDWFLARHQGYSSYGYHYYR